MRWMQGCQLPELLREIAALRTVVVAAVVAHGQTRLSLHEQSLANIIVHRFFDALVVQSAAFYAALTRDATVLRERQQIAQELHDGACQAFQILVLELAILGGSLPPAPAQQLNTISRRLRQSLDDVRTIVQGLVAGVPRFEDGLPAALQEFAADVARVVPCEVRCDSVEIPSKVGFQLFRIAQEAAANACKHARAHRLSITLARKADAFELQIRDDGRGFDLVAQAGSGIGLHNMQERARAIGARLEIESEPLAGTTITCILPKLAAAGQVA
jgi:two-component system CheB/CheR fusion protein